MTSRIVLVPSAYHPSVGGVEELTRRLAYQLVVRGHAVEVWSSRDPAGEWPERDCVDGITVRRFAFAAPRAAPAALATWPPAARRTYRAVASAADEFRPDLLHVQCFSSSGIYAAALSAVRHIPLLITLQGETVMDDTDIFGRSAYMRTGLRLALRRAGFVTGCSRFTLDDAIRRFGAPPDRTGVIFNGVDLAEVDESPLPLSFTRFVAAVGRMVDNKGFDLLIRAWAAIADRHPDVGLVIGGGGTAEPLLRRMVADLGLGDRVHLPGSLARPQVAWLLSHAAVFVMPSRVEPFGIVTLEAWRGGRPVVVSARGGAAEFVEDGRNGLVVDPFDREALGQSLERLLDHPDLAERLATAGREKVREFDWPVIAGQYEVAYGGLLRA